VGDVLNVHAVEDILTEVGHERASQHEQWGTQGHESSYSASNRLRYRGEAQRWREINDARIKEGRLTWDGILLEEVFEALAEGDDALRRAELIQVAAVAVAEIEAIDRRNAPAPSDLPSVVAA